MEEARLERTEYGLGPASEGWFVVNVHDAEWETNENGAAACIFESGAVSFSEIGYRLAVLQPRTTVGFYHAESNQEDFLVLSGACVIFMTGARTAEKTIVYPRSELALRHGAGVEEETTSPTEAYATFFQSG